MAISQLYIRVSKQAAKIIRSGANESCLSQSEFVEKLIEKKFEKIGKKTTVKPKKDHVLCLRISKQAKDAVDALSKELNISMSDLIELATLS